MPVPGQPGTQSGKPSEQKPDGDKKPDDGKKDAPKTPDVISRPDTPVIPPDPKQLLVRPNPDGMLQLTSPAAVAGRVMAGWNLRAQLDRQELPGGYLNLVTQREYTVPEARNLINRHLLARGYTPLLRGELMTVEGRKA